jgi:hypothetical protein
MARFPSQDPPGQPTERMFNVLGNRAQIAGRTEQLFMAAGKTDSRVEV